MKRNTRRVGLWVVASLFAAGCGGAGKAGTGAAADSVMSDSTAVVDSVAASTSPDSAGSDPFTGFELDAGPQASADLRRLSLLLRNDATSMAIVHADGGADEVLLDSVPAGSGQRVDLLTRAPVVTLRAETPDGHALRTVEVAVGADTVVEVLVGGAARP